MSERNKKEVQEQALMVKDEVKDYEVKLKATTLIQAAYRKHLQISQAKSSHNHKVRFSLIP